MRLRCVLMIRFDCVFSSNSMGNGGVEEYSLYGKNNAGLIGGCVNEWVFFLEKQMQLTTFLLVFLRR